MGYSITPTTINGSTGVSKVQDGVVVQADLGPNVVGNGPAFRAYANAVTSITSAINKVSLGVESFDTSGAFDTVLSRFQPAVAGYYQINGATQFASGNYLVRAVLYKNGVAHSFGQGAVGPSADVGDIVFLNGTTDYLELYGYSATTQNTSADSSQTYLSGFLARAA